ncbi:TolC family protein [Solimicrobium silvestre]|uniref:Outer membrane efflux protein n=1 Tax=Solimicrobium silvestre TaxID=2099400 RepID=A0A2S9GYL6_9BURK|nr:TolC family protein [Solimicrobium silvestre]PRC92798.1 Outer membrane efflux protein [Solimicrobium silvestre]
MHKIKTISVNYGDQSISNNGLVRLLMMAFFVFLFPRLVCAGELRLDEAIRLALAHNPDVKVQERQVDVAVGQRMEATGQFDLTLVSGANYSKAITPFIDNLNTLNQTLAISTGYQIGLNKELRDGISLTTAMQAAAIQSSGYGVSPQLQQNAMALNITLNVPLLKGGGSDEVTEAEDVGKINVVASQYGLRNQVVQTVYNTLQSYWNYLASLELLKVAQSSEERSKNLLDSNQKLVDAAEKPRADLVLLKADYADKIVARQMAALTATNAKLALGRVLGIDAVAIRAMADPIDGFPADMNAVSLVPRLEAMSSEALLIRPDVKVLALQLEAAQRHLLAAQKKLRPQLNLSLGVNYTNVSAGGSPYGFIADPSRPVSTPSVNVQLNYQFPIDNTQAKGSFLENSALVDQLSVKQRDLEIDVTTSVDNALQSAIQTAAQLKISQESLALYEQAVSQEIIKQKNGISTLIDVINVEARFVSARVNYIQQQQAYANALATLRLVTGTFLPNTAPFESGGNSFSLDIGSLVGLGPLNHYRSFPE